MYYFYNTIKEMEEFIAINKGSEKMEILKDEIPNTIVSKFIEVMDDDFNSVLAIANLFTIFKYVNNIMKTAKKENKNIVANTLAKILEDLKSVYQILGFFDQNPEEFLLEIREKHLRKLNIEVNDIEIQISKRAEAKKNKDFETADAIRNELDEKGIILKDTKNRTIWDLKALYNFN